MSRLTDLLRQLRSADPQLGAQSCAEPIRNSRGLLHMISVIPPQASQYPLEHT